MFKQNTVGRALAWMPQIEMLKLVGDARPEPANDEPFLPPPPPSLAARVASFGGRQKRYKVQRGQQLRVYDPFAQVYVEFGHERYLLAWLLGRFNPAITELDPVPQPVGYMCSGRRTLARPHLTWKIFGSNHRVYFWLREEWPEEERQRLQVFSRTHGVEVVLATWAELESQQQLLDNLQTGRQQMTTVQQAGHDTRKIACEILRHLRAHNGQATRGELGAELCSEGCLDCDAQVDAALFHLMGVGRVKLNLEDAEFGDDTRVRSA